MLNSCVLNIDNQWANEFKPFKCHWYPFGWQFNNNSSAYLTAISSHSPTCAYATTYFAHMNMEQTRNELRRNKIKRWRQTIIMSICMKGNGHWITKKNQQKDHEWTPFVRIFVVSVIWPIRWPYVIRMHFRWFDCCGFGCCCCCYCF